MPSINNNMQASSGFMDMPNSGSVPSRTNNQLTPDDFMTLFLAQVRHPNPTQPMDSAATLQQMSAMSAIKSQDQMQKTLQQLQQSINLTMSNTQVLEASNLIGKNVVYASNPSVSPLVKDVGLSGSAIVPGKADKVTVDIVDTKTNKSVYTIDLGQAGGAGLLDFKWDGKDAAGNVMDPGYYKIEAKASVNGKTVPIDAAGSFKVNSVSFDDKGLIMNLDGFGGVHMDEGFIKIV